MIKLEAKELRKSRPSEGKVGKLRRIPIYIVLDNVLDTYNVGAIFRLADAVAAEEIFLCGETATPQDPKVGHKIEKASVSTWKWVKWRYSSTAVEAIAKIKKFASQSSSEPEKLKMKNTNQNVKIIAVEQSPKSVPYTEAKYEFPLAIVVGNETTGVSKEVLDLCNLIVEIPMWGVNKSLNVMVSLAIVLYEVVKQI